jgi:hypothetical protein
MSTPSTSLSTRVDASTKAEFIKRAGELGVSPSQLLKRLVEESLGRPGPHGDEPDHVLLEIEREGKPIYALGIQRGRWLHFVSPCCGRPLMADTETGRLGRSNLYLPEEEARTLAVQHGHEELEGLKRLLAFAERAGVYNSRRCGYNKDGVCTYWTWSGQPPEEFDPNPVMVGEGKFHVHASPLFCAFCTDSSPEIRRRTAEIEAKIPSLDSLKDRQWDAHRRLAKLELKAGEISACPECWASVKPGEFEEHWKQKHAQRPSWW